MKKLIYILSLLAITLATSCVVEDSYDSNYKTAQGKLAFDQTKDMFDNVIETSEMASRVSLYLETPEAEKQTVWDFYLHDLTLKEILPNSISLSSEYTTWTFYHNGKALSQEGTEWDVTLTRTNAYNDNIEELKRGAFKLTTSPDQTWSITMRANNNERNPHWMHDATLELKVTKAVAQASHLYIYNIYEGRGEALLTYLSYKILEPVQYSSNVENNFGMANAKLEFNANKDIIEAKMTDFDVISITMQGITEEYYKYSYWY